MPAQRAPNDARMPLSQDQKAEGVRVEGLGFRALLFTGVWIYRRLAGNEGIKKQMQTTMGFHPGYCRDPSLS